MRRHEFETVNQKTARIDGPKLALGVGTFSDDCELPGTLVAKILHSPHAHARIRRIDASKARALPGVAAVLTHHEIARVRFSSAGQGVPEPSPYDMLILEDKVRFVGDRVAAVAAVDERTAQKALSLIEVDYEVLPAIFDVDESTRPGAPVIHDEPDAQRIHDAKNNVVAEIGADFGDPDKAFAEASWTFERVYSVHAVQQASIEPHITLTWFDEDHRLNIRTATQVPYHVRRIVARVVGLPVKKVRVMKPRVGGGFGGKQEILIEDLCARLTLETGKPVRLEYDRAEECHAARTRHAHRVSMRAALDGDDRITAMSLEILQNAGAYGTHSLTVMCVSGDKALSLYRVPNLRFTGRSVYTNLPVGGAFRGYGAPQGYFPLESFMDELATELGRDRIEYRKEYAIREGDNPSMAKALGEGREGKEQTIRSHSLFACIEEGKRLIDWGAPRPKEGIVKRGVGMACAMQGSAIAGIDMAAANLKMNEDGSFNLQTGATDIGTGSDTMVAQIVAETLHVPVDDIIVYACDTDLTPFDKGAYASSTTYLSGAAAKKAADDVARQILTVGARILGVEASTCRLEKKHVVGPGGKEVTYEKIATTSLYVEHQEQIQACASHMSNDSPPPFTAQFAEVEVDIETGRVRLLKFVSCVDCGTVINPDGAEGQIEGAVTQAIGYALCEMMPHDEAGRPLALDLQSYKIPTAIDMPVMISRLVESYEPTGPFGAKAIAEIPIDGPAPAIANAIFDAVGVRMRHLPITPEKVLDAIRAAERARQPVGAGR